ncbi:MAG TPA: MMPL family transporter [Mycobacteriales bacterium]|jgi:RND superfamily putative drug exporter|nr:MMPL family transporter [Mycobacteriales bacterium]
MTRTEIADEAPELKRPVRGKIPRAAYLVGVLGVLWFLFGAAGGSYQGKLAGVQKNDNAAYLPNSAESTKVDKEAQKFRTVQSIPGFVVYHRTGGLTAADHAKISADTQAFRSIAGVAPDQIRPQQVSADGATANVSVPLIGKNGKVNIQGDQLVKVEKKVLDTAKANAPPGLVVHGAGPGGLLVAFIDAFSGIDGALLFAAGLVVIAILLVVYRSPVLWFFPLFSAGLALGAAALIIFQLAKHNVLTLNGQSQGILSVLVIGAGTDYALLLISRYREELHAYDSRLQAMIKAWRGAAPAIGASAITVILGLLCLTFGQLNSDRSLGPVCAIGIACTVSVMLTFLPAFLVLFGRWIFWPRVPHVDHQADIATHGPWGRFAAALGRHARRSWIAATIVLLACVALVGGLKTGGLAVTDSFTNQPDAVVGQKIFDANFVQGSGAPAVIIANANKAAEVIAAASRVTGVDHSAAAVCVEVDYAKLASAKLGNPSLGTGFPAAGCAPQSLQVPIVDGRTAIDANLIARYDTPQAYRTITAIRSAVHAVPGANALVGGASAVNYDTQQASRHDRNLIIPIVLLVILIVLALLLRAVLAPLLLIATIVLSFTATLGVSSLVFNHLFHFKNADPAFPLFAFVFLVALGIDYNIFLMTRVREETLRHGTRTGILRGLSVTGGVITSAGVVLAATFTVLGVLPLVFLGELGFAVAFGVLLDTTLVRSILVPALSHDIGKRIWWPSALSRAGD